MTQSTSETWVRAWPEAELNPVQRLRVLAAGLPHVFLAESVIEAPIERVWGLTGDLIDGAPQFELGVHSARIVREQDDHLELDVRTVFGVRLTFDVELRFGWCLMQSRYSQIGMAAIEEEAGRSTRFAHFEGSPLLGRLGLPFFRWNIAGDMRRIARLVGRD
ncbi:MAG: hypothetical protein JRG89_23235 [Deltaproteobacteria bacterium]|nr:hypothetical protein [Deltaproteobacteria bacterium]MBW2725334.1 hypothetical protein [Deltaproteobacteria bacterium]